MLQLVKTHIAPSFTIHPRTGDFYAAYNKPQAIVDWLEHITPTENWIIVVDSDVILRRPLVPYDWNISKGWAASASYDYMIGVNNELADRHIPGEVQIAFFDVCFEYGRSTICLHSN